MDNITDSKGSSLDSDLPVLRLSVKVSPKFPREGFSASAELNCSTRSVVLGKNFDDALKIGNNSISVESDSIASNGRKFSCSDYGYIIEASSFSNLFESLNFEPDWHQFGLDKTKNALGREWFELSLHVHGKKFGEGDTEPKYLNLTLDNIENTLYVGKSSYFNKDTVLFVEQDGKRQPIVFDGSVSRANISMQNNFTLYFRSDKVWSSLYEEYPDNKAYKFQMMWDVFEFYPSSGKLIWNRTIQSPM